MKTVEFRGTPIEAVAQANIEIAKRGINWEPRPIEFFKINEAHIGISMRFRAKKTSLRRIFVTDVAEDWVFALALNHPVICLNGTSWYFGIE